MADITLVNLNMLFMRYGEEIERELHVPLGPLYLTRALEDAGFEVDFRECQSAPFLAANVNERCRSFTLAASRQTPAPRYTSPHACTHAHRPLAPTRISPVSNRERE